MHSVRCSDQSWLVFVVPWVIHIILVIFSHHSHNIASSAGNSGGPLLDSRGRLIGVNMAIYSLSGSSSGIGFSIPVDTVRRVVNQLIRYGKVVRPTLGVNVAADQVRELIESYRKPLLILKSDVCYECLCRWLSQWRCRLTRS